MTSYATLRDNINTIEDGLASTTTRISAPSLELESSDNNLANNACPRKMDTPTTPSYDPDSFSESEREKMDSTPENIKKIDDVIDEDGHIHRNQTTTFQQERQYNYISPRLSPRFEQIVSFGLPATLDDSNTMFCLAKPQCNTSKETFVGSRIVNKEIISGIDNKSNDEQLNSGSARRVNGSGKRKPEISVADDNIDGEDSTSSNGNTTMTNSMKQSCAFTINNFNDKECDAATQAAKYKSMMERFQSRHRRGASLSKLESENESLMTTKAQTPTRLTNSQSSTPLTSKSTDLHSLSRNDNNTNTMESDTSGANKVKLRVRDRSTSRLRDSSKRHSWSPRSSTNESNLQTTQSTTVAAAPSTASTTTSASRKIMKTTHKPPPIQLPKGASNLVATRTQFTPRSTAMQLALKQVDFMCPQPPLVDFKHLNVDADDVSEAGTYTLDGDNYTEEQKDLMNIDRNGQPIVENTQRTKSRSRQGDVLRPTPKPQGTVESKRSSNILEVNYYHDPEALESRPKPTADTTVGSHQSAGAYLQKIKCRVLRNMNATKQMDIKQDVLKSGHSLPVAEEDDPDLGCFTSVTTSGVLAKQRTLDARPKLSRHSGLSTSQIDSSEYVSNETKLKSSGTPAALAGGFTDHQKAEYRLNVFTNQKDGSQKFAATRNLIETPPETPTGLQPNSKISEVAALQTAQTKHDWIQEWARNVRARSLANDRNLSVGIRQANKDILMTRSYTCADTGNESLTDDSLYSAQSKHFNNAKFNRSLGERLRLSGNGGSGECDYASDPSLTTSTSYPKPPKSPTKIPSPLHSLGRARSASRTRASLQNVMPSDEEDYLQQTAAAINNLQQSLSRKNSIKSPSHSVSPRVHSTRSNIIYSPEGSGVDCSPQHSLNAQRQRQNAQNLMTSSINEQQLQMLTSGEYLLRQMRMRKNSFDGKLGSSNSPNKRTLQCGGPTQVHSPTSLTSPEEQSSPLRRSSSFSARVVATQRAARPNFQNLYTPPAGRHSYVVSAPSQCQQQQQSGKAIKKSASSNNFGSVYSDYDDNLQYYINDEDDQDDMGEEYYSSETEEIVGTEYYNCQQEQSEIENNLPLSNTRYNKALLMRIERSKQKVAGKTQSAPPMKPNAMLSTVGGVMACPNTPELPRRSVKSATSRSTINSQRQSMPRDASLSRLAQQVPNSLASAKKQLLQTAANVPSTMTTQRSTSSQRAQPRYLDISKYKPAQSNQFLRKNDAKSTLKHTSNDIMKRSPSSSSMGLSRTDPSRTSNRSVRSATSVMTTSGTSLGGGSGRASSAVRRDASISKQKEAEMAMWKRRSKYDPMKAAAEDKRKKEEAKRLAQCSQVSAIVVQSERQSRSHCRRGQL